MATKIQQVVSPLEIYGEAGGSVKLFYDNMGEPFREGVAFDVRDEDYHCRVLMCPRDVQRMRDKLDEFLNP